MFPNRLHCKQSIRFRILAIALLVILASCTEGASQSGVDLSGTITVFPGSAVDSDTNDPHSVYVTNNTPAQAQAIVFPVTLGGYVNRPNTGPAGRLFESGDIDDFFQTNLFGGQVINLNIADIGNLNNPSNNLDLFLYDATGMNIIASSQGTGRQESISVNQDGNYLIRVTAVQGASAYNLSIGLGLSAASQQSAPTASPAGLDFVPGEVIVRFKATTSLKSKIANGLSANVAKASNFGMRHLAGSGNREMLWRADNVQDTLNTLGIAQVKNGSSRTNTGDAARLDTKAIIDELRKRDDVEFAMPNYIVRRTQIPNDDDYNRQWHYPFINLPQAWDISTGDNSVVVAVIDTGVLLNHPDLQGQLVAGYDFVLNRNGVDNERDGEPGIDDNPNDPGDGIGVPSSFHGTHVAGTIAAATNNVAGAAGIGWDVRVMPLRVLGPYDGTVYDIGQAVRFAAGLPNDSGTVPAQPADIINLSLGGISNVTDLENLKTPFVEARNAGVIIVAAAGNDGLNTLYYPASIEGVVSVSATNISRQLASYSNYGATVDVSAPGGDSGDVNADGFFDGVYSLSGDDSGNSLLYTYKFAAGTSMASPHVAGVAALMKSVFPAMTPDQFDLLLETESITQDLGATGRDDLYGYGLIDASKAVLAALDAAGGVLPVRDPLAKSSLAALNFSFNKNAQRINISNAGDGDLSVLDISDDSGGWLSVEHVSTENLDGLGDYEITVDRALAPSGQRMLMATVTIVTSANTLTIPVLAQLEEVLFSNEAGIQYILLLDENRNAIYEVRSRASGGIYRYRFSNIRRGTYYIVAGSDMNNDDVICDPGEACGQYPTLDSPRSIVLQESATILNIDTAGQVSRADRSNVNFESGFHLNIGGANAIQRLTSQSRLNAL